MQTLYLSDGWTRLTPLGPEETFEKGFGANDFSSVRDRAKVEILIKPARPIDSLMNIIARLIPFAFVLYVVSVIVSKSLAISHLDFSPERYCFNTVEKAEGAERKRDLRLELAFEWLSVTTAVVGILLGLVIPVTILRLWGALASFLRWWARRNWALATLGLLKGLSTFILAERSEKVGGVLSALVVFIFGGLDFMLLLTDSAPGTTRSWWKTVYRVFYALNLGAIGLDYILSVVHRNLCDAQPSDGMGTYVLRALSEVVRASYLIQLFILHIKKIVWPSSPALRYSIRSYVHVQPDVGPGELTSFLLGDGDMAVVTAVTTENAAEDLSRFHFVYPAPTFPAAVRNWGFFLFFWSLLGITETSLALSRVSLAFSKEQVGKVCWKRRDEYSTKITYTLSFGSTGLIVIIIGLMIRLLIKYKLGRVVRRWTLYWFRRNPVFVVFCLVRGCNEFRPGNGLVLPWLTFIKFGVILPVALAVIDLVLVMKPQRIFIGMLWFMIALQALSQVADNTRALYYENPCEYEEAKTVGLAGKCQNTLLLLFSAQYLGRLYLKVTEGITVPLLNFSDADRFARTALLPKDRVMGQRAPQI
jgi:hypothetical protein